MFKQLAIAFTIFVMSLLLSGCEELFPFLSQGAVYSVYDADGNLMEKDVPAVYAEVKVPDYVNSFYDLSNSNDLGLEIANIKVGKISAGKLTLKLPASISLSPPEDEVFEGLGLQLFRVRFMFMDDGAAPVYLQLISPEEATAVFYFASDDMLSQEVQELYDDEGNEAYLYIGKGWNLWDVQHEILKHSIDSFLYRDYKWAAGGAR
jgi:hypothetical protein